MKTALENLAYLQDGNARFVAGRHLRVGTTSLADRANLAAAQAPHAIVLGCADSRVPVETIFDSKLGEIFTIRVAGNIATLPGIGSVEYAASSFLTRLVIVLGHSNCGAITASLDEIKQPSHSLSPGLASIVEEIRPGIDHIPRDCAELSPQQATAAAVRANVTVSTSRLRTESEILRELIANDGLLVVGAEYSLETGVVDFFDGLQ